MFNKDFLKTLSILFVEDDALAREKLAKLLRRFFKNVELASNGEEGQILFHKHKISNNSFDLILSDINMPKMNGIEMLEKIREIDTEVPIIFTTARTEADYLLKAIELNANHYVIKPIDTEDLINRIQKVCEKKYYQDLVVSKHRELEQFLCVVEHVSFICKMNDEEEITYINSQFLDTLMCEKEEVVGKKFHEIVHKDTSPTAIEELWNTVRGAETWHSDVKYLNKNNEVFFVNSTVFQVIHDEGYEYINIGFVSTQEVNEKREFHKKIINNIKDNKLEAVKSTSKINELEVQLKNAKSADFYLHDSLDDLKQKNKALLGQLKFYEEELDNKETNYNKSLQNVKVNLEKITTLYKQTASSNELQKKEIEKVKEDESLKKKEHLKFENLIEEQRIIIKDLRDTIKNISEEAPKKTSKEESFIDKLLS